MIHPPCFATLSSFVSAYSQSDLFGKLIFLGLISTSLLCWVVLLHKTWLTRKVRKTSDAFRIAFERNKQPLLSLDIENFPKPTLREIPHPFAQIFLCLKEKTIEVLNKNLFFSSQEQEKGKEPTAVYLSPADLELLEAHGWMTISSQVKKLEKNLFILSTIVTLAPFLGLLGTVWGILVTFSGLQAGGAAGSNTMILGGLSTALATTVLGLVIAIPALISYNYLRNESKSLSSDMEDFLHFLLSTIEIQYRKAGV